ncbi:hypothetical protein JG688_00010123 [Phytophthora aleatoria]|uniref:Wbp11/ELF5/Saf1 N-terminal domain-containing protein n=1 Tax=Phytophthora aleatoria TaxID=2496075 RepID=A0A8J5J5Z3_9STRA|nr:hypothetical protein JG688_00010123 [Phytophthora aleatoria]
MAKSLNPMEAYRREQKKKELKKHRVERQKDKQAKLSVMDPVEIREQLKNLERQVAANPTDGPTRKRKQELEDTLRAVVKKQKELADEERKKQAYAPPPPPMSMAELTQTNKEKFQNPENSIYYHPTLNPFGAPPPGKPQVYRNMPSDADDTEMQTGNATTVDREDDHVVAPYPTTDENEDDSVVAPYPPPEDEEMDEGAAERAAESRAQLRSLVPVALRVQRQVAAPPSSSVGNAPPVPAPRRPVPAPPAPAPRPPVGVAPPPPLPRPVAPKPADSSSVSKEFDAFMEEVKELL